MKKNGCSELNKPKYKVVVHNDRDEEGGVKTCEWQSGYTLILSFA